MYIVLLPGMDGTGELFQLLVQELPEWLVPLIVTYPVDQPLDYAGHLELVMAALPTDGRFILLGESFSGPLALMAAARNPAGLCGVILCATFISQSLPIPTTLVSMLVKWGLLHAVSSPRVLQYLLGNPDNRELTRHVAKIVRKVCPEVMAARVQASLNVDCSRELRQCPVPLLALMAENDRVVPAGCMETILSIRPDTELIRFDSPHLLLQCASQRAAEEISRFARGSGTGLEK